MSGTSGGAPTGASGDLPQVPSLPSIPLPPTASQPDPAMAPLEPEVASEIKVAEVVIAMSEAPPVADSHVRTTYRSA